MQEHEYRYTVTATVSVPDGPWAYATDGVLMRDVRLEDVTAEIVITEGGMHHLIERAARNKNGTANWGPVRIKITKRKPVKKGA